ncbi:MAG TPA: DUF3047 domain-containing protein [Pseudonocardia sp.]|nr:DUF3047 domain-containing protein [Pseudonocardia sp.]
MTRPTAVHLELPADRPPWTPTGIDVRCGDRVTLLGSGRVAWSGGRGAGPKHHLWGRVPGGRIFGCPQDTATVVADRSGPLELCVYRGAWADPSGALATGDRPYRGGRGGLAVTVLRWPAGIDPVDGLAGLGPQLADPRLAAAERARLLDPVVPPAGWSYLLDTGPGEMFRQLPGPDAGIDVLSRDDAGILAKPVGGADGVALRPDTVLDWRWRVDALPGRGPEDAAAAHDLLGLALRFADGHRLSWFWSTALRPEQDSFGCPIPRWAGRQTHVPVRRGPTGLGRWRRESRSVHADHERFVGPAPSRITAVELIAVSHVGHGTGRARFAEIVLRHRDQRIRVL